MLDGEKILITGATGKIAFPIARALAAAQRGLGRGPPAQPGRPGQAGRRRDQTRWRWTCPPVTSRRSPTISRYVFHAAVDTGTDDWRRCVTTNAQNSGELLYHCRAAKGFVFCSTGSVYGYQGQRPLTEADRPVCRCARTTASPRSPRSRCAPGSPSNIGIPLTIIRICSTYGPQGGAPADRLEMMLAHKPIRLHPDAPNNYNPIYEDDYVDLGIRAMEVADDAADRRELGGQRDRQRRGLLHVHG